MNVVMEWEAGIQRVGILSAKATVSCCSSVERHTQPLTLTDNSSVSSWVHPLSTLTCGVLLRQTPGAHPAALKLVPAMCAEQSLLQVRPPSFYQHM